jgi:oxygen-dependent protoporphyrinogen oxidase
LAFLRLGGKNPTAMKPNDYDVIVVGAGISGLGAALKLKDAGVRVLVLEKNNHVGGRMSTERIQCQDGNPETTYAIDRGATIFGGRFHRMKALMKKLKLEHLAQEIDFRFALDDGKKITNIRRARVDDVLFQKKIGFRGKLALMRFGLSVLFRGSKLGHGNTSKVSHLDDVSVEEYMQKIGGQDLLEHFLYPGLNGPLGANLRKNSRLILFQTFWNILLMKTWAIKGGMDAIVNAMAARLNVRTNTDVRKVSIVTSSELVVTSSTSTTLGMNSVEKSTTGEQRCQIELANGETLTCRKVIMALPGNLVPKLCPDLPEHVLQLLRETKFGEMVNAHVMLNKATDNKCAAYGITQDQDDGYEIELEHNRVSNLCAEGKGLVSLYMWNEPKHRITEKSDEEVKARAKEIVKKHFPECANEIVDTHILRWKEGIAHFSPGRLTQMSALRNEMKNWNLPVQLCGDYLDGIASESALVTGEQAAENILRR